MPKQDIAGGPVARTLSVIGSSWTCLILREFLVHGARRFQDLHEDVNGSGAATVAEGVRAGGKHGGLERHFYSMSPPRAEYVLTTKGRDLGPILSAMRDWGRKYAR